MPKKFILLGLAITAANLFLAQLSLAQETALTLSTEEQYSTQETSQIAEQLNPGNFGISHIPGGFTFSPVHITSPGTRYSYYITSPETENNYIELYDGRYDGGLKLSLQVTNHVDGEKSIPLTLESVIASNFSATQEFKDSAITTSNVLHYSESTPDQSTAFQPFPENGILVLLDAPTDPQNGGRVGIFRLYPSFKLEIPDTTPAGNYTATITYTVEDSVN